MDVNNLICLSLVNMVGVFFIWMNRKLEILFKTVLTFICFHVFYVYSCSICYQNILKGTGGGFRMTAFQMLWKNIGVTMNTWAFNIFSFNNDDLLAVTSMDLLWHAACCVFSKILFPYYINTEGRVEEW